MLSAIQPVKDTAPPESGYLRLDRFRLCSKTHGNEAYDRSWQETQRTGYCKVSNFGRSASLNLERRSRLDPHAMQFFSISAPGFEHPGSEQNSLAGERDGPVSQYDCNPGVS
jgi:hypothetical protein